MSFSSRFVRVFRSGAACGVVTGAAGVVSLQLVDWDKVRGISLLAKSKETGTLQNVRSNELYPGTFNKWDDNWDKR